jgi:hypothetical protein
MAVASPVGIILIDSPLGIVSVLVVHSQTEYHLVPIKFTLFLKSRRFLKVGVSQKSAFARVAHAKYPNSRNICSPQHFYQEPTLSRIGKN